MSDILVVEDEKQLRGAIEAVLTAEGYAVVSVGDGQSALSAKGENVDAIVMDWMLPDLSGLDVLVELRRRGCSIPVLMLTARDSVADRVAGLDHGADDYLVKPFAFPELLARLRTLLRRGPPREELEIHWSDLRVDLVTRQVFRDAQEVELSVREFQLLTYLLRNRGQTVTREMLARDIWQDSQTLLTNVIDVFIKRLRRKLDREGELSCIRTVRGAGYLIPEGE